MQPPLYRSQSPGPSASHVSSAAEAGWSSQNRSQQQPQYRRKPVKGLDDGSAASLEIAAMFPPAQRLFVLFLEAADSHRFNTHLTACAPRSDCQMSHLARVHSSAALLITLRDAHRCQHPPGSVHLCIACPAVSQVLLSPFAIQMS